MDMNTRNLHRRGTGAFLRRYLSLLLAVSMLLPYGLTAQAAETGLCDHHTEHTADCGYRAASEGAPCKYDGLCDKDCGDSHARDCAYTRELEKDLCDQGCTDADGDGFADHSETCAFAQSKGQHTHDGKCGYAEAVEGSACVYQCEPCAALTVAPLSENPPEETTAQTTAPVQTTAATTAPAETTSATTAPVETTAETTAPAETTAETTAPVETTVETTVPETTVPETTAETVPETTAETVPETTAETVPETTAPEKTPVQQLEELIAGLPEHVTQENRDAVAEQLQKILPLYAALTEAEQAQIDITLCVLLQQELDAANVPELLTTVTGGPDEASAVAVQASNTEWQGGYFKVDSNVTLASRVTVTGNVILILNTGFKLTANAGIQVSENNSLTIQGTGELEAKTTERDSAGIGGNSATANSGTITINGGTVKATSSSGGAAIGGGSRGSGNVIISGSANVTATSNGSGAAIGGGSSGSGNVTISGSANVTATGNGGGAAIGGGQQGIGDVTITGGEVHATGNSNGAAIGGGNRGSGTVTIEGGNVTAESRGSGAAIGGGYNGSGDVTIEGGTVKATSSSGSSSSGGAAIGNGEDGSGGKVEIKGGNVTAESSSGGAAIGGGKDGSCGDVTISGGTVDATGIYGAGIGNGRSGSNGTITISGGTVKATSKGGAGIGDGNSGSSSTFSTGGSGTALIEASSITGGDNTSGWSGIIFQGTNGGVYGNQTLTNTEIPSGKTLTVSGPLTVSGTLTNKGTLIIAPGGSIPGGTLAGDGTFKIQDLTEAMISVPGDLVYNGKDQSETIKGKLKLSTAPVQICGKEFQFDSTVWTPNVAKNAGSELDYTVTYTHTNGQMVTKAVTLGQSAAKITANSNKTAYAYFDTITINATVTPTGVAPASAVATMSLTGPTTGQVAVYKGNNQVSEPVTPDASGACTLEVAAKDLGAGEHTLTVKYTASPLMAQATADLPAVTVGKPDLTVTNGTEGTDYTYENHVLTIKNGANLTVSMAEGVTQTTTDRIEVESDISANVTLSGVNINVSGTPDAAAFKIADNSTGNVTVNLVGTNTLTSGENCAGLQKNGTSGSLTITGNGSLTATGGQYGAGIGSGGKQFLSSIFNSSNITISGGTVTANGGMGGAGIGGGYGGNGSDIAISGTANVTAIGGDSGAAIGGGYNGNGTVTISGGIVKATGGQNGAAIGGGRNGSGTVTITSGTVTATSVDGAGIGNGSGGSDSTFSTGEKGNAWIVASSISDQNGKTNGTWSGIIFENNAGKVYKKQALNGNVEIPNGATLTIPKGATLVGSGVITGEGTFLTETLKKEMIVLPEGLIYNGQNQSEKIQSALMEQRLTATICGQEFRVTGWTPSVAPKAGSLSEYTVTYTYNGDASTAISKDVTLAQSGTQFVGDGAAKAYKGDTAATEFAYGETVTVKANPTPTGKAPVAMAALFSLTEPTTGQMAVYYGDTQVSEAASLGADGQYTMNVTVKDLVKAGAQYNQKTTLTAKFVQTSLMADGAGTVDVTLKPATLTVTANDQEITYGSPITQGVNQVTAEGLVPNDQLSGITLTASSDQVSVENKTITPSNAEITPTDSARLRNELAKNYDITYVPGKLTIHKSQPTITITGYPTTAIYSGAALANPTADNLEITGAKFEDVQFAWTQNGTAAEPKNAGTYTLTAFIEATGNTEYAEVKLENITISPKAITVKADDKTKTYGEADPELTYTAADLVTGDTLTGITLTRAEGTSVGTYTITASQADGANPNYAITPMTGTLTIGYREAQLVWSTAPLTYNGQPQAPTATVGNLAADDTCDVTVDGGARRDAGEGYTATATRLSNPNYKLPDNATTTFAIAPKPLAVTITPGGGVEGGEIKRAEAKPDESGIIQGETAPTVTLTYTGEDGTTVLPDMPTAAGTYKVTAALDNKNYILSGDASAPFIVRRPITITVGDAAKTYGDPDPAFTYQVTDGVPLEGKPLSITLERATGENAGTYAITAPNAAKDNPGYEITVVKGQLTIERKDIGDAQVVLGKALTANGRQQTQKIQSVTVKNSKNKDIPVTTYTVTGNTGTNAGVYTMKIEGTKNFTGTIEKTFVIVPGAGSDSDGSIGTGKITEEVKRGSGAPTVSLSASKAEIIALLTRSGCLTAQELAQVAGGETLNIVFTTSGSVTVGEQSRIKALAKGYTIGSWFDISLYKQLGDGEIEWLHQTGTPIRMTVPVPQSLLNTKKTITRTFWIIRCHGNTAEFLPTKYDGNTRTLSFETDRFSGYAIAYRDTLRYTAYQNTATGTSPRTSDDSRIELWLAVLALSAVGIGTVLTVKRKKKKQ